MGTVESVTGPLELEELGVTLIHEHLCFRDEANAIQWPHLYDEQALHDAAVVAATGALEVGVRTIVEPTAMFGGRDVRLLERVARETDLQLIACTGIYTYDFLPHYWVTRDADAMADAFVHDIESGIQRTPIKAGFLKCAADAPGVTENVEKVHRACARASLRTGVPIMAHTFPAGQTGLRQMEIFVEEGVDPAKVQLAHTGDTDDLDHIEALLDTGAWIGMDRYGLEMYRPLASRNETVLALLQRGHADRMFLSADSCATIDWFPAEAEEQLLEHGAVDRDWSTRLVHDKVLPALRDGGMTAEQEHTMLVENPRRWLARG
ncbi:MAG: phosphotriesterase [Solirubrobacterales bacterium]|nr:phosphotriesterase [Solirubrobacterales bacterium]